MWSCSSLVLFHYWQYFWLTWRVSSLLVEKPRQHICCWFWTFTYRYVNVLFHSGTRLLWELLTTGACGLSPPIFSCDRWSYIFPTKYTMYQTNPRNGQWLHCTYNTGICAVKSLFWNHANYFNDFFYVSVIEMGALLTHPHPPNHLATLYSSHKPYTCNYVSWN